MQNPFESLIFMFMLGAMLDYVGLRRGMIIAVIIWSLASTAHA